ncbi:uncharacterized protein METZ01_LOCUS155859 [marine metagenome]|uniref:Uncharacterized protein n=1 Tax=marine metagenome TaxID=408172 RepID=A0A382AN70_9ZZZZ
MTLTMLLIVNCFFQKVGSDPTMDYSSLKGSGLSPQDYDILVKQRQAQYAKEIGNDHDDWIPNQM